MSKKPLVWVEHKIDTVNGEVVSDSFIVKKEEGVYSWNRFTLTPDEFSELKKILIEFSK